MIYQEMTEKQTQLLEEVRSYTEKFFQERISEDYAFHDIQHIQNVVNAVEEIGEGYSLSEEEMLILKISAWFHDLGYDKGAADHEARSIEYSNAFLKARKVEEDIIEAVAGCIKATAVPQKPQNQLEEIICDADMSHLGKKIYWHRCGRLRQELIRTSDKFVSDEDWIEFELDFMVRHNYHTKIAQQLYGKRKSKHIRQLYKQKRRLTPEQQTESEATDDTGKKQNLSRVFELKQLNLGRGVETMYRTTYRTHMTLSAIADNKANIMLSINAIIISILVSTLVPSLIDQPFLIIPTGILLSVCLTSIVFATLSTRPKITSGTFNREDIEQKRSNLLFFGNFFKMDIEDFHWGMMEMIKDQDFLYSSMTRDIYYLGVVLAKKYRFLSICYTIFMYGLIVSVISFGIAYAVHTM